MDGIVAENGKVVTDEMIAGWESALERDEWPSGWVNVGDVVDGRELEVGDAFLWLGVAGCQQQHGRADDGKYFLHVVDEFKMR